MSADDSERLLHQAASVGNAAEVARLLEAGADPNAADAQVRLLLDAAPEAALERQGTGATPLFLACTFGRSAAVQRLLAAAPQAARTPAMIEDEEVSPLAAAVNFGHLDVVRLLLEADPPTAWLPDSNGSLPLHHCVAGQIPSCAAAAQLLLTAAPGTAMALNGTGLSPLHLAAMRGNVPAVRLLVHAAPEAIRQCDTERNLTPLEMAMLMAIYWNEQEAQEAPGDARSAHEFLEAASAMLAAAPQAWSLPLLAHVAGLVGLFLPLFSEVAAHWPLTAAQWQHVPAPCPGLGRALPAVLARSEAEAALLVARLPAVDSQRLRTFALALHRAQRHMRISLAAELTRHILSLFDA
ncbi:hypothetical protein COHA_006335 [Chlorella ohadii]|uniref:Uncharacterized protein n=1 Tax=Chlorella ohadii TaxID=2649997 RepID=A0AAD5DPK8_9CHLO|nr:hypothetical protein COHA_006335 [Chlorella ohadii]